LKGQGGDILPVRRTQASHFFLLLLCAVVVAGGYGFLLHTFTNAWAPWLDSFDFDLQRSGTIHVDGKTYRKLVRLVSGEYPGGR
ncbi:hypothetical protein AAIH37_35130, partial [Pseudomonas aeruginosa]